MEDTERPRRQKPSSQENLQKLSIPNVARVICHSSSSSWSLIITLVRIITHKGELSGICPHHGTTPTGHKEWCFYKIYDADNESGSKSIVKTPSSDTGSLSSERLQYPTARVQKVGIPTSSFAGPSAHRVTLQKLIRLYNLTGEQLSSEISDSEFPYLTEYFDGVMIYSKSMGLTPAEQADVNMLFYREGTQVAMIKCFTFWKTHNPYAATYRALLELLLKLRKEKIADEICQHFTQFQ
ncbi:uncharacterized protein LOC135345289 isoform X4 [Halichondria panicea]|uniref:uncharacterized protein LOC135345289 isoform X4 n=1 Tax=Halichondria panicea TaxID=6063 RepID=UPI00312B7E67